MPLSEISPLELERADRARLSPLIAQDNNPVEDKREAVVGDDDKEQFLPVRTLRQQYINYLDTKVDEIEEQKDSRHYYHGAMWTAEQIRILRARHQPIQTWNRVARKLNGIVGLLERQRSDPKALPRTPKSEQGAEIATQSVRYVLDANEFKTIDPWCLLQASIDGIAGVQLVLTQGDKGDPDIALPWVIGDEYFYDPKSYRLDFKDARYEGIAKWLDVDAAIELFPDKEELLRGLVEGDSDLTTNADREYKWVVTTTKRLRLVEHWYKHKGNWCWAFYVSTVLLDQGISPFKDDKGKSDRSFRMFSCAVDHDGDRYGLVRNLKGPQDALNQGKSKTLALANSRRIISEKGAVDDVEISRREAARHDGFMEINPGKQFKFDDTKPDIAVFSAFTEDAKNELDGFANSNIAAMTGAGPIGNLSGRAIELLRQPGMAELGPFSLSYRAWKLEVYRGIWNAVQRHWTAERWIRVNNNEGLAQFLKLNGLDMDPFGRPMIVNAVGSLDVDIILEEGPDIASMMQETSDALRGYPPGTFPPQVIIEMSTLPRSEKTRLLQMMAPKPPPQDPLQQVVKKLQVEGMAGKNAKTAAEVEKTLASAEQARATATEKMANAHGAMADTHLSAAQFVANTLREVSQASQPPQQQQGIPGQPQGPPPPQQMQLPFQFPPPQFRR
jgi:hypothetical protein